jgi:hypothetical protein
MLVFAACSATVGNLRLGCQRHPRDAGNERDAAGLGRTDGLGVGNRIAGSGRG